MKFTSKRALASIPVGTIINVTHYRWPGKANGLRRVIKTQTNATVTQIINPTETQAGWAGKDLWMHWDSKVRCEFDEKGVTAYMKDDNKPLVRYEWVEFPA